MKANRNYSTAAASGVESKMPVALGRRAHTAPEKAGEVVWLPSSTVTAKFGITRRTLDRWMRRDALDFPKPMVVNGRLYFLQDEIATWQRESARRHAASQVA
jgi:predicted DNA-binding transcriptional regulator AlpA